MYVGSSILNILSYIQNIQNNLKNIAIAVMASLCIFNKYVSN
jgi:hypothetical protein